MVDEGRPEPTQRRLMEGDSGPGGDGGPEERPKLQWQQKVEMEAPTVKAAVDCNISDSEDDVIEVDGTDFPKPKKRWTHKLRDRLDNCFLRRSRRLNPELFGGPAWAPAPPAAPALAPPPAPPAAPAGHDAPGSDPCSLNQDLMISPLQEIPASVVYDSSEE